MLSLQKQIEEQNTKNINQIDQLNNKIYAEKHKSNQAINQTLKTIESASTGGIHILLIGIIWLLIGVILAQSLLSY